MSRRTEKVHILVDGVALHSGPAELLNKLLSQILNVALLSTNLEGLFLGSLKVLLLADVCHEADDAIALVDEVSEDTAGVKTTRVCETDLYLLAGH